MKTIKQNCIIDNRISSVKQLEGSSLESQQLICERFAESKDLNVLRIFSKVYSGRADERADFEGIIDYIKEMKKTGTPVSFYIVKSLDRLTRKGAVKYSEFKSRLAHLDVRILDSHGLIQPEINTLDHLDIEYSWSRYSPTDTAQLMEAERGKSEVRDILTRMLGAEIAYSRDGFQVRRANDGYLNSKVMIGGKKRVVQIPDPVRSKYISFIFKARAKGVISDLDITKQVNGMGYLTLDRQKWSKGVDREIIGVTKGQPMTVKRLQKLIANTKYAGVVVEKWTRNLPVRAQYDGLVSMDIFNKANRGRIFIKETPDGDISVLYNSNPNKIVRRRMKHNPLFPLKNLILCHCGKSFCASSPRGKTGQTFPTYHCSRNHKYHGYPKKEFEENVKKFMKSIRFDDGLFERLERILVDKYRLKEKEVVSTQADISSNIAELKYKQEKLIDELLKTNSDIVRKRIEERIDLLSERIEKVKQERSKMEVTESDIQSFIKYAKKLMEHPYKLLVNQGNFSATEELFALIFDGLPTYEEILNGTPKLTLLFKVSEEMRDVKSQLVTPRRIELRLQD
jgi:site-specific DNA recombinase